jgi:hypothetical protein
MNRSLPLILALLAVCAAAFAGGNGEAATEAAKGEPDGQFPNYTGLGGKGISIEIRKPQGSNLGSDDWLSAYVQNNIYRNFQNYSAMNVSTPETREAVIDAGESGAFANEEDFLRANQAVVTHILTGTLSKVSATEYSLNLSVTEVATGIGVAPFTRNAAPEQLRDGATLNQATAEILTKLGIQLTAEARAALSQPLRAQIAESQIFLARADTASTQFGRIQYTYQAAAIDPSLTEAARRLSAYQAATFEIPDLNVPQFTATAFKPPAIQAVRTGNIGADARNEVARYRANQAAIREQQETLLGQRQEILDQWQDFLHRLDEQRQPLLDQEQQLIQRQQELVTLLREAEAFYAEHPPFRIFYNPEAKQYGGIDRRNATLNMRVEIASEPVSVDALKDVLDALQNLNKSFTTVNTAFEDVNRVMTGRLAQVKTAMNAIKDALDKVNTAGEQYDTAPVSADWTVPPGSAVNGAALTTSWPMDYQRTFSINASLLNDKGAVIGRGTASLTNDFSWSGDPLKPETAFTWCNFNNVKVDDITDTLTVRIDAVNGKDVETAAARYIAIDANRARADAIGRQVVSRESWRNYWSDTSRFYGIGAAVGSGVLHTPMLHVSAKALFSPFPYTFFEAGSDFGLVHGEQGVRDVEYFSVAPYLHLNGFFFHDWFPGLESSYTGFYAGIGGGGSFSTYTYPSESHIDPVTVNTLVFDGNVGMFLKFSHSVIDLRATIKTNFKYTGVSLSVGYTYRFGYF